MLLWADTNYTGNGTLLRFIHWSTPCVAAFLFLSGYGYCKKFSNNCTYDLLPFVGKLSVKLFVPFLLATGVFQIGCWFCAPVSIEEIWQGLCHGYVDKLLCHAWYPFALLFYGVGTFVVCKLSSGRWNRCFFVAMECVCVIVIFNVLLNWPFMWWKTSFAFFAGFLWAAVEDRFDTVAACRSLYCSVAVALVLLLVFFVLSRTVLCFYREPIEAVMLAFAGLGIYLIACVVKLRKFAWLGLISYEVYLNQGVWQLVLKRPLEMFPYSYTLVVVVFTMATAFALNKLSNNMERLLFRRVRG